jgi:hypothetical protein
VRLHLPNEEGCGYAAGACQHLQDEEEKFVGILLLITTQNPTCHHPPGM